MLPQIMHHILMMEKEETRVLYAVEAGSRLWRMASPDSDYDVRIVYCRPTLEYLRLRTPRDNFELKDGLLDIAGWDLRKTMILAHDSNPALLEWLSAPMDCVYIEADPRIDELRVYLRNAFSRPRVMRAYLGMAKTTLKSYFPTDAEAPVNLKKYLYALRPTLAVRWMIEHEFALPPTDIGALIAEVLLTGSEMDDMHKLLDLKMGKTEATGMGRFPVLDRFINETLETAPALAEELSHDGPDIEVLEDIYHRATTLP